MRQRQVDVIESIGYAQAVTEASSDITSAGGTFTGHIHVPNQPYGPSWNGSTRVPTQDAVYDKIESLVLTGGGVIAGGSFNLDDGDAFGGGTEFMFDDGSL